jgi:glycerol-3-phosphate acyltransferase PlsY
MQHINEPTKTVIDGLSVATVLGALTAWLPPIAALFTIIWTAIRIWETDTVKKWTKR